MLGEAVELAGEPTVWLDARAANSAPGAGFKPVALLMLIGCACVVKPSLKCWDRDPLLFFNSWRFVGEIHDRPT